MGIQLLLTVLDVNDQLTAGYDQITVFRSLTGPGGPFAEITGAAPTAAELTSTIVGPYTIQGTYLELRVGPGGVTQRVDFTGTDPVTATDVASQITTAITGLTASVAVGGEVTLTVDEDGGDSLLEVVGGDALSILGFTQGEVAFGLAARIPLVEDVTKYLYFDPIGVDTNYYQIQFINSTTLATTPLQAPVQGHLQSKPKQQAATTSPRGLTLIRGTTHTFRVAFFDDVLKTTPLTPADAGKYPTFQIIDSNGGVVVSGLATLDGTAGNYRVEFSVPKDAYCSNDDRRWRIEFFMLTDDGRQASHVVEFDVRDENIPVSEEELDYKTLAFPSKKLRVFVKLNSRPMAMTLDVFNANNKNCVIVDQATYPSAPGQPEIVEAETCGQYVYHYTIPAGEDVLTEGSTFTALWEIERNIGSAPEQAFQIIEVVPSSLLQYFPSLRMVIDKYRKRRGTVQAYSDADIYEYLQRGLEIVNGWHPFTTYGIVGLPSPLTAHWMLASSIYGLNAQHLLETDLQFCVAEGSLVHTNKGLVKVEDLGGVHTGKLASEKLWTPHDIEVFDLIKNQLGVGKYRTQQIIEACSINTTAQQLGLLFTKFNLNTYRETDHKGGWLWDVGKFWSPLSSLYGYRDIPEYFQSKYDLRCAGSNKKVVTVWNLGEKAVKEVRTEYGYPLKCTENHEFLVLNADDLTVTWKPLKKVQPGDLIAIDTTGEPTEMWDVDLPCVAYINTNTTKSVYGLPKKLTPALARVLGYLTSEGCQTTYNNVTFCNSNDKMSTQFVQDFEKVFGDSPDKLDSPPIVEGSFNYGNKEENDVAYVGGRGVELRRFLAACGLTYTNSRAVEIPWVILQAPLHLAAEWLKAHFDGDGCWDEEHKMAIFCSRSPTFRTQLQALLLRFGIFSRDNNYDRVTIVGPSVQTYEDRVGWLIKKGEAPRGKLYPQRESLPLDVFRTLKSVRDLIPGLGAYGWYKDSEGNSQRARVYWRHSDVYAKYTTWNHVENWWEDRKPDILKLAPEVAERIEWLLATKFQWLPVTSIEDAGTAMVYDPTLVDGPDVLDHGYTAGGIITHNSFSGQTVTLDYDHTANLDSAISRSWQWLQDSLTPAKTALLRRSQGVGAFAGKPYRYRALQNYTFKISSRNSNSSYLETLSHFGLL